MKIRMLTSMAGVKTSYDAGVEYDYADEDEAKRLIEAGVAEAVVAKRAKRKVNKTAEADQSEVETASLED